MREKKFTPGPWKVGEVFEERTISIDEVNPSTGRLTWDNLSSVYWTESCEEEGKANANLIAAAPELLEALENAHADIVAMIWGDTTDVSTKEEIAKYLHKAIVKAYGE